MNLNEEITRLQILNTDIPKEYISREYIADWLLKVSHQLSLKAAELINQ